MSKVIKEPDFAELGFQPADLPQVKVVRRPYVIYLRLPEGIKTFALTKDGRPLIKWGKDLVLPRDHGFMVIKPRSPRWRIWFWWRRWRRKLGI